MLAHTLACFALLACVSAAPTGGKEHGFMSGAPVLSEDTEYLDFAVKNVRTHLMELSDAVPDKIELIGMTSQVRGHRDSLTCKDQWRLVSSKLGGVEWEIFMSKYKGIPKKKKRPH